MKQDIELLAHLLKERSLFLEDMLQLMIQIRGDTPTINSQTLLKFMTTLPTRGLTCRAWWHAWLITAWWSKSCLRSAKAVKFTTTFPESLFPCRKSQVVWDPVGSLSRPYHWPTKYWFSGKVNQKSFLTTLTKKNGPNKFAATRKAYQIVFALSCLNTIEAIAEFVCILYVI